MFLLTTDQKIVQNLRSTDRTLINIGSVRSVIHDRIVVDWSDGSIDALTQANMSCLGLVSSVEHANLADQIASWWHLRSGETLEVLEVNAEAPNETVEANVNAFICDRVIALNAIISAENTNLWSQTSSLRRSYDALQSAFSRLETAVYGLNLSTPLLVYESEGASSFWAPSDEMAAIEQRLPCLSTNFSTFDLFFDDAKRRGSGHVTITLRIEPAGDVVSTWIIAFNDILPGWNSFTPPPIIDEPNELVVTVAWSSPAGAPKIGLGSKHWNSHYAALKCDQSGISTMLSLRVWAGLPGVRAPARRSTPKSTGAARPKRLSLMLDDLAEAAQYMMAETPVRDYKSVMVSEAHGGLLVHPHAVSTPTLAVLPTPIPSGATFITVQCSTVNRESAPIDYALALIPAGMDPETVFEFGPETFEVSDWLRVQGAESRKLQFILRSPATGEERLCFATRLSPPGDEASAWAIFSGVDIGWGWSPKIEPARPLDLNGATKALSHENV